VRAGKGRVSAAPVVAGDLLLVFTDAGELSAFRGPPVSIAAVSTPTAGGQPGVSR
jgi:hypothetical protein